MGTSNHESALEKQPRASRVLLQKPSEKVSKGFHVEIGAACKEIGSLYRIRKEAGRPNGHHLKRTGWRRGTGPGG